MNQGLTFDPKATPLARAKAVNKLVDELKADTRPILLGPWRSELGFEALYWLPFLRYIAAKIPHFDKRAVVITRGGLAPLYKDVASQGYDLYALRSLTEIRRETLYDYQHRHKGVTTKQVEPTDWDDAVLADAADALGLGTLYHVLHPAWMYWALAPFWAEQAGLHYLISMADYRPLPKIAIEGDVPPKFVAMKWYGRPTFPYPHPEIAEFVQETVARVAQQTPVILLHSGSDFDDHVEIPIVGENVHTLPPNLSLEENLRVQAAVLGRATAFIGTYGGVAQLALRLGIPSVSFYADWHSTCHAHLALSSWLSKQMKVPFCVGSLTDAQVWKQVMSVPGPALPVAA